MGCLVAVILGAASRALGADSLIFVPVTPCRVIDTRLAGGALAAGSPRTFFFRGPTRNYSTTQGGSATGCGIPDLTSDFSPFQNLAKAVAINIVAVGPAGAGDLRAWPSNQTVPNASVINYASVTGLNIANGVIVPMCDEVSAAPCAGGDITFRADVSGAHLVVDVVGYFHAGSTKGTLSNTGLGHQALQSNTTGRSNTAVGYQALLSNTTGNSNTATGFYALGLNTTGKQNTAVGTLALGLSSTASANTAVGAGALHLDTSGYANTAVGTGALELNGGGQRLTAIGAYALSSNSSGAANEAVGYLALGNNTTGSNNTAVGHHALYSNTTGSFNLALGFRAGYASNGTDNIFIGSQGFAGDNSVIRIGNTQSFTFIQGIRGVTTGNADAVSVVIDSAGQLGTVSSSIRFKEDVHDLGSVSDRVLELRPVSFRYRKPFGNGEKPVQYGLIAEEVEKVFPELVAYGQDGKPETVKYQVLPTLLLGELEKEHAARAKDHAELVKATAELAEARSRLREQDARLAAVLRRLDALESRPEARPAPQR